MYDPSQQDEAIMAALQDLGFQVWWNGYSIVSNTTEDIRKVVASLVSKGWVKGE